MIKLKIFKTIDTWTEREFHKDDVISIGRADENTIVLKSSRISKEHCKIYFTSDEWKIIDLGSKNGTRVNNKKIDEQIIGDGDIIQITDIRIDVILEEADSLASEVIDNKDRTNILKRPASFPGENSVIIHKKSIIGSFLKNGRMKIGLILLSIVLVIVISVYFKQQYSNKIVDQEKFILIEEKKKEKKIENIEIKRKATIYLNRGKKLFEGGGFSRALIQFITVLDIYPLNEEAAKYTKLCKEKIEEEKNIKRLQEGKEKQLKERVNILLNRVKEFYDKEEYNKSKDLLAEAKYLFPSDKRAENLLKEIDEKIKAQTAKTKEESQKRKQILVEIRNGYNEGQKYYDQGKYYSALKEWERIISIGIPCNETDNARNKVNKVRVILLKQAKENYERSIKYYDSGEYSKALKFLQIVVELSPKYKDAKEKCDNLLKLLEKKAKRLYQEGIVYEGIGQIDKANKKWKEVLETIPIESNLYYQKANRKLQK